jgi:hypothetical protein
VALSITLAMVVGCADKPTLGDDIMTRVTMALVGLLFVWATAAANATTCQDLVQNCIVKGGTKQACSKNMNHCLQTCTMIGAYSGKSFQADEGCGRKKR